MLSDKMLNALNGQVKIEAESSNIYLSMASWAETQGLEGVSQFLYGHSDEERQHMLKLVKYINERGGSAVIPGLRTPEASFGTVKEVFSSLLQHETFVSKEINSLVNIALEEKDYSTHNFLQWYVAEQIEEEALARLVLDKINLIGDEKGGGMYLFDRDINKLSVDPTQ